MLSLLLLNKFQDNGSSSDPYFAPAIHPRRVSFFCINPLALM